MANNIETCSVDGCDRPRKTKGLCNTHAERLRVHGDVQADRPVKLRRSSRDAVAERLNLARRVEDEPPYGLHERCLEFPDSKRHRPMMTGKDGRATSASRVAYIEWVGEIPGGMYVLHRCDNPRCIEPSHLFLGSQADNMADKIAKGRDRSSRGEQHFRSRLDDLAVREIRRRKEAGETVASIARNLDVAHSTVKAVVDGRTWRHVT